MKTIGILSLLLVPILLIAQSKEFNFSKGKDEMAKENYNLAVLYFNLAIEEDSLYIKAYSERGLAKQNTGDHKGAMKDYEFVLQNEPENARAYFGMASVKDTRLNDKYGAIADYTKVIDISLKNGDKEYAGITYVMRAKIKQDLGDERGYINDLKKASELGNKLAITLLEIRKKLNLDYE
jgi:tetratricopeptide (TPR) repeat protein